MGSKKKYAKEIGELITKNRVPGQWVVDAFAGSMRVIEQVDGNRIANDINRGIVSLYKAIVAGWQPPTIVTKEDYDLIKNCPERYPPELTEFVAHACSFGGKRFSSYAQNKRGDNYAKQGGNALMKQRDKLVGVQFLSLDYRAIPYPPESIIYCDPPYQNTIGYNDTSFNHEEFWEWARTTSDAGHTVYVSEYTAPDDFECVWEKTTVTNFSKNNRSPRVERLFTFKQNSDSGL